MDISLNTLGDGQSLTTLAGNINTNNATIVGAFVKVLDKTVSNPMLTSLDMNSNQILNLPAPSTINSPMRVVDVAVGAGLTASSFGLLAGNNTWSGLNTFNNASTVVNGGLTGTTWAINGSGLANFAKVNIGVVTAAPAGNVGGMGLFIANTASGLQVGTGVPSFSAGKGTLYINITATTTTTRLYINTDGGTTWTNFTSAA